MTVQKVAGRVQRWFKFPKVRLRLPSLIWNVIDFVAIDVFTMATVPRAIQAGRFLPAGRTFATLPALPLSPPSVSAEDAHFQARVRDTQEFFDQPRFSSFTRPYTAADIVSKQGSLPVLPLPSTLLADKLWRLFKENRQQGKPVHTMGAVDPVQMTQMAAHQEVVYVSGWAASSLLTTCSNEVGPDIG